MKTFRVAVCRISYYDIRAENEIDAINHVESHYNQTEPNLEDVVSVNIDGQNISDWRRRAYRGRSILEMLEEEANNASA